MIAETIEIKVDVDGNTDMIFDIKTVLLLKRSKFWPQRPWIFEM